MHGRVAPAAARDPREAARVPPSARPQERRALFRRRAARHQSAPAMMRRSPAPSRYVRPSTEGRLLGRAVRPSARGRATIASSYRASVLSTAASRLGRGTRVTDGTLSAAALEPWLRLVPLCTRNLLERDSEPRWVPSGGARVRARTHPTVCVGGPEGRRAYNPLGPRNLIAVRPCPCLTLGSSALVTGSSSSSARA
jgi:hypothetical protein